MRHAAVAMLPLASVGCQEAAQSSAPLPSSPPPVQSVASASKAAPSPTPINSGPMPGPCGEMPLLLPYWREGALEFPTPLVARLHLVIDLHFADCGAPDCYGHDVELTLTLAKSARGCGISSAASISKSWGCQSDEGTWRNEWRVQGRPLLTDPNLDWIVLRDPTKRQALELGRDTYYFYESIIPGARLLRRLQSEDDDPKKCCFGLSSSKTHSWASKYGSRE